MGTVLIIGAGGVGGVVVHKCAMNSGDFKEIHLASRTLDKCRVIRDHVEKRTGVKVAIHSLDADHADETVRLLKEIKADIVINVALPYQDLSIMDACLEAGVHYLDTANYEPREEAKFEYKWQWAYREKFRQKGLMALLGSGFDPGVTNVFCAHALKHEFDLIRTVDILDCNAGSHGKAFATNFNPEINIREVTQIVRHWDKGHWIESPPIIEQDSVHFTFDYPETGPSESYLLYHEEMESLVKNLKGLERIRFWMTFSGNYLTHLRVLQNVGMTGIKPVKFKGTEIVPVEFLKAVLPEPSTLGENYTGKTVIGNAMKGTKDGREKGLYIYNVCDHAECYREVGAQAISYTTGVPAMIGAKLMLNGKWKGAGVFNMEEMDPDPFMEELNTQGLPWKTADFPRSL